MLYHTEMTNDSGLQDRIRSALDMKPGLTQRGLAEFAGVTPQAISGWLRTGHVSIAGLIATAKYTGVTLDWLISGNGTPTTDSRIELGIAEPAVEYGRRIPVISWIQAGDFCDAEDPFEPGYAEEWVIGPEKCSKNAYALRVRGISMEPRFREGEVVIVDPDRAADPGKFVIAKKTGSQGATLKQLIYEDSSPYLKAINPAWPEQIIKIDQDWHICGVVIGKIEML